MYLVGEALVGDQCMGEPAGEVTDLRLQSLPLRCGWRRCDIVMLMTLAVVVLPDYLWWLMSL